MLAVAKKVTPDTVNFHQSCFCTFSCRVGQNECEMSDGVTFEKRSFAKFNCLRTNIGAGPFCEGGLRDALRI